MEGLDGNLIQIGVGGIFAILVIREFVAFALKLFQFAKSKKNGHKPSVEGGDTPDDVNRYMFQQALDNLKEVSSGINTLITETKLLRQDVQHMEEAIKDLEREQTRPSMEPSTR